MCRVVMLTRMRSAERKKRAGIAPCVGCCWLSASVELLRSFCAALAELEVHTIFERVGDLAFATAELESKWYTPRKVASVLRAVRQRGVDGRASGVYLKTARRRI